MHRILLLILAVVLTTGYARGQSLPSVFIYYTSKGGDSANWAAFTLEGLILNDLGNQYRCIDLADEQGVKALLDFERMRDLLGADATAEQLAQVGGAIGARYVVTVKAIQMANGSVYLTVSVLDTVTAKMIVSRDEPPTDPKNLTPAIESLKNKILGDMASFLKGKCDEHWTGTITYRYRLDKSGTPQNVKPPGKGQERTTKIDNLDILLKPMSLGSTNPSLPGVKITRHFEYHTLTKREEPAKVMCRPRGANSYWRNTTYAHSVTHDETGDLTVTRSVYVEMRQDGTYTIKVSGNDYPLKATYTHEVNERPTGGCEDPPPYSSITKGENNYPPPYLLSSELKGKWDPRNPDALKGSFTEGNAEEGVKTLTWDLRRVKPKSRLDK